jgi:hypothetical protein
VGARATAAGIVVAWAVALADGTAAPARVLAGSAPTITTVAGTGAPCTVATLPCGDGGKATKATLAGPMAVVPLGQGAFLIADRDVPRIRRVGHHGKITTVAGTGQKCTNPTAPVSPCGDGGLATRAQLNIPHYLIAAPNGAFIIADRGDNRVREVFSSGIINTIAGDGLPCQPTTASCGDGGLATQAQITAPQGVSLAAGGALLIGGHDNRIREAMPSGTISTVAGTGSLCAKPTRKCGDGGPATSAQLSDPHGVAALPNGGFLIADRLDNRIRQVSPSGNITTVAGTGAACNPTHKCGDGGTATKATLNKPVEVTPVPGGGFLILDSDSNRVRYVNAKGTITTLAGSGKECKPSTAKCGDGGPATKALLARPHGAGITKHHVYIADRNDNRIRRVDVSLP